MRIKSEAELRPSLDLGVNLLLPPEVDVMLAKSLSGNLVSMRLLGSVYETL